MGQLRSVPDPRVRASIPMCDMLLAALACFVLQKPSLHAFLHRADNVETSSQRQLRHLLKGRVPGQDALGDALAGVDVDSIRKIHYSIIRKLRRNGVLDRACNNVAGRYRTIALDGSETLASLKKRACPHCLARKLRSGGIEHYHRAVACMTVGGRADFLLDVEMLDAGALKDEASRDEGK